MPVRSFTADASSKVGDANQGTFKGVAEKVYLDMRVVVLQSLHDLCQLRMKCRLGTVGCTLCNNATISRPLTPDTWSYGQTMWFTVQFAFSKKTCATLMKTSESTALGL